MKLKPCPFCGGKAAFGDDGGSGRFVECTKCKACSVMMFPEKCDVKGLIAERWNERTTTPGTPPAEVEKVLGVDPDELEHAEFILMDVDRLNPAESKALRLLSDHISAIRAARRVLGIEQQQETKP